MFRAFLDAFVYETEEIKKSFYKISLLFILPFLSFFIIVTIFQNRVSSELPLGVVDFDNSKLSRDITFAINSSPTLKVINFHTKKEAFDALKSSKVYGLVVFKSGFFKDVATRKEPNLDVFVNSQYILIGKTIESALMEILLPFDVGIDVAKNMIKEKNILKAVSKSVPIRVENVVFFNKDKDYFLFLTSAILPSIWQIFIVVSVIVSFGSMYKEKKDKDFFSNGFVVPKILGKLFVYFLVFTLWGVGFMFYIYSKNDYYFAGDIGVMIVAVVLTVVSYEAIGVFLFTTGFDYARSLSLAAVYTAPAFAFLGVTFPVYGMGDFALFFREMLPVSHFTELFIKVSNFGYGFDEAIGFYMKIISFSVVMIFAVFRIKRRIKA